MLFTFLYGNRGWLNSNSTVLTTEQQNSKLTTQKNPETHCKLFCDTKKATKEALQVQSVRNNEYMNCRSGKSIEFLGGSGFPKPTFSSPLGDYKHEDNPPFFLLFKGDRCIDISNPEDYNVLRICFNWVEKSLGNGDSSPEIDQLKFQDSPRSNEEVDIHKISWSVIRQSDSEIMCIFTWCEYIKESWNIAKRVKFSMISNFDRWVTFYSLRVWWAKVDSVVFIPPPPLRFFGPIAI